MAQSIMDLLTVVSKAQVPITKEKAKHKNVKNVYDALGS